MTQSPAVVHVCVSTKQGTHLCLSHSVERLVSARCRSAGTAPQTYKPLDLLRALNGTKTCDVGVLQFQSRSHGQRVCKVGKQSSRGVRNHYTKNHLQKFIFHVHLYNSIKTLNLRKVFGSFSVKKKRSAGISLIT